MRRIVIALAVLAAASACRRGEREVPDDASSEPRTFAAGAELLFVYAGIDARFETAASAADVPQSSRRVVRVIEPTVRGARRSDDDRVYVVDLRSAGDELRPQIMSRSEFERRALAALPPGQLSRLPIRGARSAQAAFEPHDRIILYSASWCGACRQARTFLTQRHVEFVERDVERDEHAGPELAAKARAAGISATGVPIIDVRGKLVVGFDAARLATLIGEAI